MGGDGGDGVGWAWGSSQGKAHPLVSVLYCASFNCMPSCAVISNEADAPWSTTETLNLPSVYSPSGMAHTAPHGA